MPKSHVLAQRVTPLPLCAPLHNSTNILGAGLICDLCAIYASSEGSNESEYLHGSPKSLFFDNKIKRLKLNCDFSPFYASSEGSDKPTHLHSSSSLDLSTDYQTVQIQIKCDLLSASRGLNC